MLSAWHEHPQVWFPFKPRGCFQEGRKVPAPLKTQAPLRNNLSFLLSEQESALQWCYVFPQEEGSDRQMPSLPMDEMLSLWGLDSLTPEKNSAVISRGKKNKQTRTPVAFISLACRSLFITLQTKRMNLFFFFFCNHQGREPHKACQRVEDFAVGGKKKSYWATA